MNFVIGKHRFEQIPLFLNLVTCIWGYMGCAKHGKKPDKDCKEDFNDCSMLAMGMAPASTTTTARCVSRKILQKYNHHNNLILLHPGKF